MKSYRLTLEQCHVGNDGTPYIEQHFQSTHYTNSDDYVDKINKAVEAAFFDI